MNLEKATEIQQVYLDTGTKPSVESFNQAVQLGIEALKGIVAIRCGAISNVNQPLPGETKD